MSAESQSLDSEHSAAEDSARAGCYALIGRLFYDAPDADLLAVICNASPVAEAAGEAGQFASAWGALQGVCRNADVDALRREYDSLFISVGKAAITLYTSRYVPGAAADKHLVRLREHLDSLGLARHGSVFEVEDHISGLCDVMRHLIEANQALEDQHQFFDGFVRAGAMPLCVAVEHAVPAVFYKHVAAFALAFFEMEKLAFEMGD
ncbi:MAG: molecular chaperone TorD family protein [Burkholderiales bacterium]|nr:molecular chaperone TorD family protein [Burkholderiales bacterium]